MASVENYYACCRVLRRKALFILSAHFVPDKEGVSEPKADPQEPHQQHVCAPAPARYG